MRPVLYLPFLTASHPKVAAEGALDPLGLAPVADRLADLILPGLRVRMARPRFLTAMAVSAHVCEGLHDEVAKDGVTPAYLTFEWLVVEGLVRAGDRELARRTPGIEKAQTARNSNEPLCARTYLKAPSIFGFNGVYRPIAMNLGIVDEDFRLSDNGYALVRIWEEEQNLTGFLDRSLGGGPGGSVRQAWRGAVESALEKSCSDRSSQWVGWKLIADHLSPSRIGRREAAYLKGLLEDGSRGSRSEIFKLLTSAMTAGQSEAVTCRTRLGAKASPELKCHLDAIEQFEAFATELEFSFDTIRYESSLSTSRPISPRDFGAVADVKRVATGLRASIDRVEAALETAPLPLQLRFLELSKPFTSVTTPEHLFEGLLVHHRAIQAAKPPTGKRDWFEHAPDGAIVVRTPYRLEKRPAVDPDQWGRPYRVTSVLSFLQDLKAAS
jgi:hypothetical protein